MNANEQLDFYNPDSIYYGNSRHYIQQLEAKVRQQQAEIEALKAAKIRAYDNGVEDGTKPNTNLVKELTDDKIADLIKATNDEIGMKNIRTFDFTKVLLRKAQEK